jgi:hypothetical protein
MNGRSELWEEDERFIRQYGIDNGIILTDDMIDEFCEWVFDLVIAMTDQKARELALQQLKQRYEI